MSESQCEARTATPDALDSPPAMPDSRFLPLLVLSLLLTLVLSGKEVWGLPVLQLVFLMLPAQNQEVHSFRYKSPQVHMIILFLKIFFTSEPFVMARAGWPLLS